MIWRSLLPRTDPAEITLSDRSRPLENVSLGSEADHTEIHRFFAELDEQADDH